MDSGEQILNWSNKAYGIEPDAKIAAVINYEAGDVSRDFIRISDYPECSELYESQARVSMGDVLAMCQLLCTRKGWNFQAVYKDGCQRAIDRCKEKIAGKNGF
jgi:hypothetical protein